jgi:hypothetical protein
MTRRYRYVAVLPPAVVIVSYSFYELAGGADYLPVGVLAGNLTSPWLPPRSARERWRPRPFQTAAR